MKKYIITLLALILFVPQVSAAPLIESGDKIIKEEDITDSAFFAANEIDSKINTTDSLYLAANKVKSMGDCEYIYGAGSSVEIQGNILKNAFLAGNEITSDAKIEKDLFAAGGTLRISSIVNDNVYLVGKDVVINGVVNGDAHIVAETIKVTENGIINGKLVYNEDAKLNILNDEEHNRVKNIETYKLDTPTASSTNAIATHFLSYLNVLVLGLLILYFFKKPLSKLEKEYKNLNAFDVAKSVVNGLVLMVAIPVLALILLIFQFGIATSIIGLIIYGILIYLSTIITTYIISNHDKISKYTNSNYLSFALVLLVIYILELIPYIGVITTILVTLYGFDKSLKLFKGLN